MKTTSHKLLKAAAIIFAALTPMLAIGACAHHDREAIQTTQTTTRAQTHTHAPGTPPHND